MSTILNTEIQFRRIIGEYRGAAPGATVICMGGLHGNEHAAIVALQHVARELMEIRPDFKGKFVALAGNLAALPQRRRFIEADLNRIWTAERMQALENSPFFGADHSVEQSEQREIFRAVQYHLANTPRPVYVLDLHTTSAESPPFTIIQDSPRHRQFALNFHAPVVLGLLKHLRGSMIQYLEQRGCCTVAFEAGQHDDERSIHRHIAAIWIALVNAGCIAEKDIPDYDDYQEYLHEVIAGIPKMFEVTYRYAIEKGEVFTMEPGFINFQNISRGQLLATSSRRGKIYSREEGYIFMPLYQSQGDDGFFVIRDLPADF